MIYVGFALLLPAFWFGFWWCVIPVALALGWILREGSPLGFALGAGVAWAALAFLRAGEYGEVISRRLAGMFSLPGSGAFYVVVVLIGFLTAMVWFLAGRELRVLLKR